MKRYLLALLITTSICTPALADQTSGGSSNVNLYVGDDSPTVQTQTVNNNPVNINQAQGGTGGSSHSVATGGSATGGSAQASTGPVQNSASTGPVSATTGSVQANPSATTGPVQLSNQNIYKPAAPSAIAPSLTANDCMGSITLGVSFVGTGAAGGYTFHNKKCERMEDVNMAVTLGMKKTAMIMMEYPDMSFEKAALIAGEYIGPATVIPAK